MSEDWVREQFRSIDIDVDIINQFIEKKIFNKRRFLRLTEKEIDTIIYLSSSKKPINIKELQSQVWDHKSNLETHTVETHIHRLRKKIKDKFGDENFIISSKSGYLIE